MEILLDACMDSVKMLPFLFLAFLLMELLEYYYAGASENLLRKVGKAGPAVGTLAGCIPQCGFSVLAANLYAGGVLSVGTLLAVFVATSDEAVLIIMAHPERAGEIGRLLVVKILIAVIAGYLIDRVFAKWIVRQEKTMSLRKTSNHIRRKRDVVRDALEHTCRIFIYLFIVTAILNISIEILGLEKLSAFLLGDTIFQPVIAALIGLIPNCASSVILTQLYLSGAITFASVIAGLCTGAGVGLIVLFKMNKDKKESFRILFMLFFVGVIAGEILQLLK